MNRCKEIEKSKRVLESDTLRERRRIYRNRSRDRRAGEENSGKKEYWREIRGERKMIVES